PRRGDVVVFKSPQDNRTDFIKRVVGLPGDRIRMVAGQIELNGALVPKNRVADFVVAMPQGGCRGDTARRDHGGAGPMVCSYPRYVERLDGRDYSVLDQIPDDVHDDTPLVTVPPGHYFVEGDNRDDSADSRLTIAEGGVGMVPVENLVGRAEVIFFSTTGQARPSDPASWRSSLRLARIGERL
ncbi:MAG: signal peptidase I, partial [Janthinobacterium lividum]